MSNFIDCKQLVRITTDPIEGNYPDGGKVITFKAVCDRPTKKGDNYEPMWIEFSAHSNKEGVFPRWPEFIKKGDMVQVSGPMDFRCYMDRNNQPAVVHVIKYPTIFLLPRTANNQSVDNTNSADADDDTDEWAE